MTRSIRTFVCELPIPPRSTYVFSIINTNYHRSFATCRDHTRIHLLAGKQCCQALNSAAEANESVDARRLYEFAGCGIDGGIDKDHPRAPGEVIRPLPVIAAHRATMAAPRLVASTTPGQIWPTRPRSHLESLPTRYMYRTCTYLGKVWPKARLDRSKWLHGLPDGCAMLT